MFHTADTFHRKSAGTKPRRARNVTIIRLLEYASKFMNSDVPFQTVSNFNLSRSLSTFPRIADVESTEFSFSRPV